VKGENQLLALLKDMKKHLTVARRTTQAAEDIEKNLSKVVTGGKPIRRSSVDKGP
jgi:hypothetical protein